MKSADLVKIVGGVGVGAVVGYFARNFIQPVVAAPKLRILVNAELATYVGTLFGDIAKYNVFFDVNHDGQISMQDVAWFASRVGTWVELPV